MKLYPPLHRSISSAGIKVLLLAISGSALPSLGARSGEPSSGPLAPFLKNHCTSCHGGEKRKGGLVLDGPQDELSVARDRKKWEKVVEKLRARKMPPKGRPQPATAEVASVIGWIEARLSSLDCQGPLDPGRVTIRRLNRVEYNNTVRDLLGVDFQPAEDFPSDDVGYGFDNIGDVLSLPPLLMEKYLAAAEKIVERGLAVEAIPRPPVLARFEPKLLEATAEGKRVGKSARSLNSEGELLARCDFPRDGEYLFRVRAYGEQAGPDPARMALRVEGKELQVFEVKARAKAPGTYEAKGRVEGGARRFSVAFLNDYYKPDDPDPANRDRNLVVDSLSVEGPLPPPTQLLEMRDRLVVHKPEKEPPRECARQVLRELAGRAFRRPASKEELERLLLLVETALHDGETLENALRIGVEAVLVSPHFLFRVEVDRDPAHPEAAHPVSDHELASRLSYFLWSSMPDEELFALAELGALRRDGNLETQVKRMLADPRSKALVENFAGQWLGTRKLRVVTPDPARFPQFDEELRAAMERETELFFQAVLKEDLPIATFIDSDFTFLNERLARHYGIPGVKGEEFRRVKLAPGLRGGVLTQASVLTITSNPTRTSPVKRGKWILEQVLGTPPPAPPPDAGVLSEAKEAVLSGSLRERMEQHRSRPDCSPCHSRMDPLGFAFENFDGIGAYRELDGKFPIDGSGVLPGGRSFKGAAELKAILLEEREAFARALTEKLLTFALGRGLEYYDQCAVEQVVKAAASKDYRFQSLVVEVVKSVPFTMRRGPGRRHAF
jgi:hypothetical protein